MGPIHIKQGGMERRGDRVRVRGSEGARERGGEGLKEKDYYIIILVIVYIH